MQIFISDEFTKKKYHVEIHDLRIVNQVRKVLRWKAWYEFFLQNKTWKIKRKKIKIEEIWKTIVWKVIETSEMPNKSWKKTVIQSILNKASKMELIVQKLTEIWIDEIYFIKTRRSVISKLSQNKIERLHKIALEATEQSFGWQVPKIEFVKSFDEVSWEKFALDFDWKHYGEYNISEIDCIIVGPEWWFQKEDFQDIWHHKKISLWTKILRSETASIVWSFIISA